MKRFISLILMALLLCASVFASSDIAAKTSDGRIVILHEDNTYDFFVEENPETEVGFSLDSSDFLGVSWDSVKLVRIGNTLNSRYTLGEFYMLEFSVSGDSFAKTEKDWVSPVLKLDNGETIKGFCQSFENYYTASSTIKMKMGKQQRTTTYSLIFEVPQGTKVTELGIGKKNADTQWTKLGNEVSL